MGWFIRKGIRIGRGLRLNISKSGFGISAGIKGLRVSKGPRGTELYGGRHGVYFRKGLGKKGKSRERSETNDENVADGSLFGLIGALFGLCWVLLQLGITLSIIGIPIYVVWKLLTG